MCTARGLQNNQTQGEQVCWGCKAQLETRDWGTALFLYHFISGNNIPGENSSCQHGCSARMDRTTRTTESTPCTALSPTKRQKEFGSQLPLNISAPLVNSSQGPCWSCTMGSLIQTSENIQGLQGPPSSHTTWTQPLGLHSQSINPRLCLYVLKNQQSLNFKVLKDALF